MDHTPHRPMSPAILLEFDVAEGIYCCAMRPKRGTETFVLAALAVTTARTDAHREFEARWRKMMVEMWTDRMREQFGRRFISVEEQLGSGIGDYYRFGLFLVPGERDGEEGEPGEGG